MAEMVLVKKIVSKVFGDFVSKLVNDILDILKSAIKDADLDRKSYNQNLQTRLYQLIVDALNRFTYNEFEKQDKLYDAAESIIKGYISSKDNTDAAKSGLKMLVSGVNDDTCQEFLEILCGEICRDNNSDLYKEFDMLWKKRESEYFYGEFEKIDQNDREMLKQLNDLKEVLEFIRKNMNRQEGDRTGHDGIPIINRAGEYADKWNKNVFLNDFNKEDENVGVNIKLREIYKEECLPHYIWKTNSKPSNRTLRDYLKDNIFNNQNGEMLLILGQPGIGKSTLITWIIANLVKKEDDILVYQFANDLGSINWQSKNVLNDIFKAIGLEYDELENKLLILDGLDEIYAGGNRERMLNKLYQELKIRNALKNFSLVITCRQNYIYNLRDVKCNCITLQAWNEAQINIFCRAYWEACGKEISEDKIQKILENKDIFGIPLILYMILALDITIEKSSSIVDVYDQIFSLGKGGIYDRCYDTEHRINEPKIKKYIHHISQKIAFWIFENNADKAFILQENFKKICKDEKCEAGKRGDKIESDTLIGGYFKIKHCEGKSADEVNFVHRSIYEYFVALYFFESIHNLTSKEEVAGKLGELLKDGHLTVQILEFIECKFDGMKGYNLADITRDIFNAMLCYGMTYYTKVEEPYNNVVERERNIFTNMLKIVNLWNISLGKVDKRIIIYLQCNRDKRLFLNRIQLGVNNVGLVDLNRAYLVEAELCGADLSGAYLSRVYLSRAYLVGADLRAADLNEADLSRSNLGRADLRGANLREANLREALLNEADLRRADLTEANLEGANLCNTVLDEEQVGMLHEKYNLSMSRVGLLETNETLSYQEYCIRKKELNRC